MYESSDHGHVHYDVSVRHEVVDLVGAHAFIVTLEIYLVAAVASVEVVYSWIPVGYDDVGSGVDAIVFDENGFDYVEVFSEFGVCLVFLAVCRRSNPKGGLLGWHVFEDVHEDVRSGGCDSIEIFKAGETIVVDEVTADVRDY